PASYQLQVSLEETFPSTVFEQAGITATSATVTGLDFNTLYYWRVRATNTSGDSEWSETWNFTTLPPGGALVAHWMVDEGSGTTRAVASPSGSLAQSTGGPLWVPGMHAQAIRFSGSVQFAAAPDHEAHDMS